MQRLIASFFAFNLLAACGQQSQTSELTSADYRAAGPQYAGLVKVVSHPTIKVCMTDSTNSQARKDTISHAILTWVDALRDLSPEPMTSAVEFVASNAACDASVRVDYYDPAMTTMGSKPALYIAYNGWYGSSTIILHELGHAFGLLDTYNGRGGSCQAGQADSVMCWANRDTLYDDDIQGIRNVYQSVQAAHAAGIPVVEKEISVR